MLIEFYGQNFACFRDEFRLSMLASDIDPNSDRGILEVRINGDDQPLRLLRAAAIYGPNASGKSTVIRAAAALHFLIGTSARLNSDAPLEPHLPFGVGASDDVVRLGLKAVVDGDVYDYQVQFNKTKIVSERLAQLNAPGEAEDLLYRQGQSVSGKWLENAQFALISQDFRPNVLLLSLADRFVPSLAEDKSAAFRRLLRPSDALSWPWQSRAGKAAARRAQEDEHFRDWLLARLQSADLGIADLTLVQEGKTVPVAELDDSDGVVLRSEIELKHHGGQGQFSIPWHLESAGTRRLIELAPMLFDLGNVKQPLTRFMDELHESLHPTLFQAIIREFNCQTPMENVRGQLIFTTHETLLMDAEAKEAILRRDQVYLTEKARDGAAKLYSVAEFKERNNHNMRHRYLQGRYGALPAVATLS